MTAFEVREERNQNSGDGTGLNGFKMAYEGGDTHQENGFWGDWKGMKSCASGFTGFKQKIQGRKYHRDGAGMTDVALRGCGSDSEGRGNCGWGSYGSWSHCPSETHICGFTG
jgi:hypothetical protein